MGKFKKKLMHSLLAICIFVLVSSILVSTIFAKYTATSSMGSESARVAAFDVVMETGFDNLLSVNFAADGEPGNPLGHSRVTKDYHFSVISNYTEVALSYEVVVSFNDVLGKLMYKGKANPYQDGISCYYELCEVTDDGEKKLVCTDTVTSTNITKITYLKPYLAPNPNTSRETEYIFRVIFYNNTDMTANTGGYTFSADAITVNVNATQVGPDREIKSIVNGTETEWDMSKGLTKTLRMRSLSGSTQLDLQIPISETGNYSLDFDANMGLVNHGSVAYMSVPKTVFEYKENIPITYNILNASNITDDTVWIAIAGSVNNEELYAKWGYIEGAVGAVTASTSGTVNHTALTGAPQGCASAFRDSSGNLLPGNYRIYLIQGNGQFYDSTNDVYITENLLTDPINITILPPDDLSNQSVNKVENDNVMLSTPKAVYTYGEEIEISYNIKKALGTQSVSWVSIVSAVDDKYSCWKYLNDGTSGTVNLRTDETTNKASDFAGVCRDDDGYWLPGYYRIVLVDDKDTLNNSSLLSDALGILVLPESTSDNISSWGTTPYGTASMTLNSTTNIFYTGEAMPIKVTYGSLTGNSASAPWVARGLVNMNAGTTTTGVSNKGYYIYSSEYNSNDNSNTWIYASKLTNWHSFGGLNTPGNYLFCFGGSTGNVSSTDKPQIPMNYAPFYTPMIGVTVVKNYRLIPKVITDSATATGEALDRLYTSVAQGTVNFTATQADVNNGYVTLSLDFSDFDANTYYKFYLSDFEITRNA